MGVALIAFLLSCLSLFLLYRLGTDALIQEVRRGLIQLAATAAVFVDGESHKAFTAPDQEKSPAYTQAVTPLKKILGAHPDIRFLYTMVLHDGKPCFILDATPSGDVDHDGIEDHSPIMQPFESPAPALLDALTAGKAGADAMPITDAWGTYLSGYAPFHDAGGRPAGIVGVDLKLNRYVDRLAVMRRALAFSVAAALAFSLLIGLCLWWFGWRTLRAERKQREIDAALKRSEVSCRDLERDYRMLFEQMDAGFALHEMIYNAEGKPVDYRFLAVNPAFERLTGLKAAAVVGKTVLDVMPQTESYWIESCAEVVRSGTPLNCENYSQSLGRYFQVTAYRPAPGQFGCIMSDITKQKRMEAERAKEQEQLQHVQKLEGLGLLAGGIAHDFNNLLMAILGNADLALEDVPPGSPQESGLMQIKQISFRAAELCKQLLAYSGKGKFHVEPLDLSRLLAEMVKLIEVSISKKIALRYNLSKSLAAIEADATQLRQVIMNLVINAADAIGENNGVIALTTGEMDCDETYLRATFLSESYSPGQYVYLEVSDTGCGMDKDTVARIFDPFYTTKFTGRGLGLAAVMGIVRGHGGAVKVTSEPGKGTTFRVLFPASDQVAAEEERVLRSVSWRGSGTVLLVDDEEAALSVARRMLERAGFKVITGADGCQALELFKEHGDKLACVLMDLTMPHMDGDAAFREMQRIRPDVPVILSSGYNPQDVHRRCAGKGMAGFIQKPYELASLLEILRSVLDQAEQ